MDLGLTALARGVYVFGFHRPNAAASAKAFF
jgi:hypothetical protein